MTIAILLSMESQTVFIKKIGLFIAFLSINFSFADWELEAIPAHMTKKKPTLIKTLQSCENNTIAIPDGWDLIACVDKDSILSPIEYDFTFDILNPNRRFRFLVNNSNNELFFADDDVHPMISQIIPNYPFQPYANIFHPGIEYIVDSDQEDISLRYIVFEHSYDGSLNTFSIRIGLNGYLPDNDLIYISPDGFHQPYQYYAHYNGTNFMGSERVEQFHLLDGSIVMLLSRCNQETFELLYEEFDNATAQLNQIAIELYHFYLENGYFVDPPIYGQVEMDYFLWYNETETNLLQQKNVLDQYLNQLRNEIEQTGCAVLGYS